jgi:hypothetical protein
MFDIYALEKIHYRVQIKFLFHSYFSPLEHDMSFSLALFHIWLSVEKLNEKKSQKFTFIHSSSHHDASGHQRGY